MATVTGLGWAGTKNGELPRQAASMTITAPTLGRVAEAAPAAVSVFVPADTTDEQLVELWLRGKSPHTQRAYRTEAERFLSFVTRPLPLR